MLMLGYNSIILVEMAVSAKNCDLVENGLEDYVVLYSCLSSNVKLLPLLVPMFYTPALSGPKMTLKFATDSSLEVIPFLTGRLTKLSSIILSPNSSVSAW